MYDDKMTPQGRGQLMGAMSMFKGEQMGLNAQGEKWGSGKSWRVHSERQ